MVPFAFPESAESVSAHCLGPRHPRIETATSRDISLAATELTIAAKLT
jgi:hypothetical protein